MSSINYTGSHRLDYLESGIGFSIDRTRERNLENIYNNHDNHITPSIYINYISTYITTNTFTLDRNSEDFIPFKQSLSFKKQIKCNVNSFPINEEDLICGICLEKKSQDDMSQVNCKHTFCGTCFLSHLKQNHTNFACPFCRKTIENVTFQHERYKKDLEKFT